MKAIVPLLAAVIVTSCAQDSHRTQNKASQTTPAKAGKKPAPKPKPYPLDVCLVTGDDLDEMDERVSLVHQGQTFEFCCKPCVKKFRENPGKYVRALEKAQR